MFFLSSLAFFILFYYTYFSILWTLGLFSAKLIRLNFSPFLTRLRRFSRRFVVEGVKNERIRFKGKPSIQYWNTIMYAKRYSLCGFTRIIFKHTMVILSILFRLQNKTWALSHASKYYIFQDEFIRKTFSLHLYVGLKFSWWLFSMHLCKNIPVLVASLSTFTMPLLIYPATYRWVSRRFANCYRGFVNFFSTTFDPNTALSLHFMERSKYNKLFLNLLLGTHNFNLYRNNKDFTVLWI